MTATDDTTRVAPESSRLGDRTAVDRIVVGVDGTTASRDALEWAVAQADAGHRPLRVLSAAHGGHASSAPPVPRPTPRMVEDGWHLVEDLVGEVRARFPELDVSGDLVTGDPRDALAAASEQGSTVVVGHRDPGEARGLPTGEWLAAHARGPVVVVRGRRLPGPGRAVVLGLDTAAPSAAAIDHARRAAIAWVAPLVVVTATGPDTVAEDPDTGAPRPHASSSAAFAQSRTAQLRHAVHAAMHSPASRHELAVVVGHGPAVRVLLEESRGAGLVVLGCRRRGRVRTALLGSVGAAVLRTSTVTVAVVPDRA